MPVATSGCDANFRGIIDIMLRTPMTAGVFVIAGFLAACVSHEGVYAPACSAFAGDRIKLHQGQFSWEKFTDSVVVDGDGEDIRFPVSAMPSVKRVYLPSADLEEAIKAIHSKIQGEPLYGMG